MEILCVLLATAESLSANTKERELTNRGVQRLEETCCVSLVCLYMISTRERNPARRELAIRQILFFFSCFVLFFLILDPFSACPFNAR